MDPGEEHVSSAKQMTGGVQPIDPKLGVVLEKLLTMRTVQTVLLWLLNFLIPLGILPRAIKASFSLAIFVALLIWLHRFYHARREQMAYSPRMAVGAWFIPVVNLVRPALILRDVWKAVRGPGGAGVIFLCWFFFSTACNNVRVARSPSSLIAT